jgi:glycosyltransferase involved in cell wall biosynthesis
MASIPKFAFVTAGLGFGGSTTFLCNIGEELNRRNCPTVVISLDHFDAFNQDFKRRGVRVITLDDRSWIFEDRIAQTVRLLGEFNPTCVVGCLGSSSYEALRYVPIGITRVGLIQADHKIFYDAIAPYAGCMDRVAGVSQEIQSRCANDSRFAGLKTACLPYGIAIPTQARPTDSSHKPLRILYFGRLQRPQKRVHLFPKILDGLISAEIPFSWSIVGDGEELNYLAEKMKTSNGSQIVTVRPGVPMSGVPDLLKHHDIFLLASDAEGLPLSMLEAMAFGLVPVVSDLPSGIRDLVDPSSGFRVPIDDTAGYANAIIQLHRDRAQLRSMSVRANEKVARDFSVQAMTNRWLDAFPAQGAHGVWPEKPQIKPPLTCTHPLYFSKPMRPLRRLALRIRSRYKNSKQRSP